MKENSRINVIQVLFGLQMGGLERVVVNLVNGLDKDRFNPTVCCLSSDYRTLSPELEKNSIKIIYMDKKADAKIDYSLPIRLAAVFRSERADIIHTHNNAGYLYGVPAAILASSPVVIHTQHGRSSSKDTAINFIRRMLYWRINRIVVVAEALKWQLNNYSKIPLYKMVKVPNGIKDEFSKKKFSKPALRRKHGFIETDRLIGIVARLDPIKDHRNLLYSFYKVLHKIKNAKLVIVGDGSERPSLESLTKKLKIEDSVYFLGIRKDISEILPILDLFVLTSKWEGMSLTLLEAMASSLPIIATDVGGNSELIKNKVNGVLVSSMDSQKLAEAIVEVLKDKKMAKKMGNSGRIIFEQKYTLRKTIDSYQELYEMSRRA